MVSQPLMYQRVCLCANLLWSDLEKVPGIGPITASALVATIGDATAFHHGHQLAAWVGLVPRQHSSGGKMRLHGISKRGDVYLRTLLIHGARSVLRVAARHTDPTTRWLKAVQARRNANIAAWLSRYFRGRALLSSASSLKPSFPCSPTVPLKPAAS